MNHDSYNCNENSAKSNGRTDLRNHQWSAPKTGHSLLDFTQIKAFFGLSINDLRVKNNAGWELIINLK